MVYFRLAPLIEFMICLGNLPTLVAYSAHMHIYGASSKYRSAQRSDVAQSLPGASSNGVVPKRYVIFNSADTRSPEISKRNQLILSNHNFFKGDSKLS